MTVPPPLESPSLERPAGAHAAPASSSGVPAQRAPGSSAGPGASQRPAWRGLLHAVAAPAALLSAGALVLTGAPAVALVLPLAFAWLFGASALYHRSAGRVSPRTTEVLRRLDHSNIFVVIAATYTPLAILGLGAGTGTLLLTLSWVGALLGVLSKLLWPRAPRALTAPVYVAYASLALWFLPAVLAACGTEVLLLLVLGMLAHVLGAAAYGTRKPDLHRDFGHHEVFHACTILGFAAHLAMAAALA